MGYMCQNILLSSEQLLLILVSCSVSGFDFNYYSPSVDNMQSVHLAALTKLVERRPMLPSVTEVLMLHHH